MKIATTCGYDENGVIFFLKRAAWEAKQVYTPSCIDKQRGYERAYYVVSSQGIGVSDLPCRHASTGGLASRSRNSKSSCNGQSTFVFLFKNKGNYVKSTALNKYSLIMAYIYTIYVLVPAPVPWTMNTGMEPNIRAS